MTPQNKYKLIDLEFINEMADGDDQFVLNIIEVYKVSVPNALQHLKESIATEDAEGVVFYIHKLKGSFYFIGVSKLTEIFTAIEESMLTDDALDKVKEMLPQIEQIIDESTAELKELKQEISGES